MQAAADEVARTEPAKAIELEHQSLAKLKKLGVKVVTNVDKSGFIKIAEPFQDKLAKQLGPHAEKILQVLSRSNRPCTCVAAGPAHRLPCPACEGF